MNRRQLWQVQIDGPAGVVTNAAPPQRAAVRNAILPALLALVIHLPTLRFGFVRDDVPLIVGNVVLRGPGGLGRLLTMDFLASGGSPAGLWRPLVLLMFWIEGRLGNWTPLLFHATNVALDAVATFIVGLLLLQSGLPGLAVLASGLWFAAMPAHVESVAWILGRTDLLCGTMALLCLWLDRRSRDRGRGGPGVLALAAFTAALLSKEAAAGWMAVIAAAELARTRAIPTRTPEIARWLAPYAAITVLCVVAHTVFAGPSALPAYVDAALRARRVAAGWVMLPQFLVFLWPWYPHSSDVAIWLPPHPFAPPVLAAAAFTLAAFAGVLILARRRSRWVVPATIALVGVLPSLGLAFARGYVTSGERLIYLSSAGIAWLGAMAFAHAMRGAAWWRWSAFAAAAVLIGGGIIEVLRTQPSWVNDAHVFATMMQRQPDNPIGWVGYADVLAGEGQIEEGLAALSRAETLAPQLPAVPLGRARIHYQQGDWPGVLAETGRALDLDETSFEARAMRASTLIRLRRTEAAAKDIHRLMRDQPDHPTTLALEGQFLMAQGRVAEAAVPLAKAANLMPNDPSLWFALAHAHAAAQNLGACRADLERGLQFAADYGMGWMRLGEVCAALGDTAAAEAAIGRARLIMSRRAAGTTPSDSAASGAPR